jgi:hypothetical protein
VNRFPDWPTRFDAFVRARWAVPFAWGSNDCALFAADAVQALTGEVVCAELRGHRNAKQALRRLSVHGGLHGLATLALGPSIAPVFARVGDVVLVPSGKREALAVCNGGTALQPSPRGLLSVSMRNARAAWRVG